MKPIEAPGVPLTLAGYLSFLGFVGMACSGFAFVGGGAWIIFSEFESLAAFLLLVSAFTLHCFFCLCLMLASRDIQSQRKH